MLSLTPLSRTSQADIPKRVVSSQRLSMLRLAIKQQEAATEALRYKMQVCIAPHPETAHQLLLSKPSACRKPSAPETRRPGASCIDTSKSTIPYRLGTRWPSCKK
eukprot:scaffold10215_cov32-Tisochrysis_lutea.AAC.4